MFIFRHEIRDNKYNRFLFFLVLDKNLKLEQYRFAAFWFKLYQFTNDTQDVRPALLWRDV
jgi:hypothetical protein